ncbi:hypothetical protein PM082_006100 [Marasmius tenuissimus]|nr:hypothetical protein PM082_006100 [Marasmius tenuissimus]
MTTTAQKYGIRMEGISFSRESIRSIPIWYHGEADKRIRLIANSQASQCLRNDHQVKTTGDALNFAEIKLNEKHRRRDDCECTECTELWRQYGCIAPNGCINRAEELLNTLPPKWDPRETLPEDFENEKQQSENDEDWIMFRKEIVTAKAPKELFRVFTEGETTPDLHQLMKRRRSRRPGPPAPAAAVISSPTMTLSLILSEIHRLRSASWPLICLWQA